MVQSSRCYARRHQKQVYTLFWSKDLTQHPHDPMLGSIENLLRDGKSGTDRVNWFSNFM